MWRMVHSVLLTTLLAAPFASVPAQEPSGLRFSAYNQMSVPMDPRPPRLVLTRARARHCIRLPYV